MKKAIFSAEHQRFCLMLREMRTERGLRQADLAETLEVNQTFVSKYERGERRLDLIELRQVCAALGTTLAAFVQEFESSLVANGDEG